MELNIGRITIEGEALLSDFVNKMGLDGALVASAEGLEMASYFKSDLEADLIAADMASLLASTLSVLEDAKRGNMNEMIISSDNGAIAIKDLGDDIVFGVLAPSGYKMGSLTVSLKQFVKSLQEL